MSRQRNPKQVPKLCGADIELGNFIKGLQRPNGTGSEASRAVLREIQGFPLVPCSSQSHAWSYGYGYGGWGGAVAQPYNPQDWGRKYLASNGGCIYIDLDHLELALPEVLSAFDHVAAWHAMLRIVRCALDAANAKLPDGQKIQLLVNNSDGHSHTYGSHLNFLVTRRAWDNIFNRKLQHLLFLAAYQVSSIVFTGQGKVGGENGTAAVPFQLAQRADYFETLSGVQTTYCRPLVNARDESLCGPLNGAADESLARLHSIFFDAGLCQVASLLKVGVSQIVLAMIEAERVDLDLLLDDPLDALRRWSRDPSLQARAGLASGSKLTAVEVQMRILEEARRFHDAGGCDGIVPRAEEILALWEDTLLRLRDGDFDVLAQRLDWVLKQRVLARTIERNPQIDWQSPAIRHLDQIYGNLDPETGLYWAYERTGGLQPVVSEGEIDYFVHNPPADTRAWTRATLLRLAGTERVTAVDWDSITFKRNGLEHVQRQPRLELANPLQFTRAHLSRLCPPGSGLAQALAHMGADESSPSGGNGASPGYAS